MVFDWVTWSVWLVGFVILIVWIVVPYGELKRILRARARSHDRPSA